MMKKILPVLSVLAMLLFFSCDVINPEEDQPAYLVIDSYEKTATPVQGGATEKITDAWVYVDGNFVGAFTIPANIPILAEGESLVEIFPGVKINGIAAFPESYTFYKRNTSTENFVPGAETVINPIASYLDETTFVAVEQFNDSAHMMSADLDNDPGNFMEVVLDGGLDGQCGLIHLDTAHRVVNVGSIPMTEFPEVSSAFFLEMDYKTDINFAVGIVGYDALGQFLGNPTFEGIKAKSTWNKIYFDLSAAMSDMKPLPTFAYYRLEITAFLAPDNEEGLLEADIYVDNLKLLMFQE